MGAGIHTYMYENYGNAWLWNNTPRICACIICVFMGIVSPHEGIHSGMGIAEVELRMAREDLAPLTSIGAFSLLDVD